MKNLLLVLFTLPLFAQSADVGVVAHTMRPRIPGGGTSDIFITAINEGPDAARNVRVTVLATEGVRLREIHATGCTNFIENVVCTLGDLERGASRNLYMTYDFPIGESSHFLQAEIAADTTDPDPFDNKAPVQIDTIRMAAASTHLEPRRGRADPGGTFTGQLLIGGEVRIPPGTRTDLRMSATNGVIEKIDAPSSWTCTYEGANAHCTTTTSADYWTFPYTVRVSDDRSGRAAIVRAEGQAQVPGHELAGTSEMTIDVYKYLVVSNTTDAGAGSLRGAIEEANATCTPGPCKIAFELAPDAVIVPQTPFPRITASRVILESRTPVILDGSVAGEGLELHAVCESAVRGLTFRRFFANQGLWLRREIGCPDYVNADGSDISDNVFEANLRGLRIDGTSGILVQRNTMRDNTYSGVWMWEGFVNFYDNVLERNGASGLFLGPGVRGAVVVGNRMSDHPHMGIAVAKGAQQVDMRTNTIVRSGVQAIDWGINGPDPANDADVETENNPPVLLSATYDAVKNATRVTLSLRTSIDPPGRAVLEFFADGRPQASRDAERVDGTPFTIELSGDLRGKWIDATSTRVHYLFAAPPRGASSESYSGDQATTSEISNSIYVP